MRVLKDKVFERVKAFNLVQMTDFVITRLEGYYERKLLDAAHNRATVRSPIHKEWLKPPSTIFDNIEVLHFSSLLAMIQEIIHFNNVSGNKLFCFVFQDLGNHTFHVPSQSGNSGYVVDEELRMCECHVGRSGALCKHQVWLSLKQERPLLTSRSMEVRTKFYIIATGILILAKSKSS